MPGKASRVRRARASDVAIMSTALAIVLVLASNLIDLTAARTALQDTLARQQTAVANNAKVEAQLEALASGTQDLAMRGNANAQRIVDTLKQNGVSINPTKQPTP